ncbi:hypothetical protein LCGC14_1901250 [marine sediment metagenome]|uniref:Uncharacterized protein n=1 Tax=marine sediment metagenome TaxID=412755 RepID=A0A0F9IUM5_9ZZZZ
MTSSTSSSEAPDDGARFRFPWAFLVALLVGLGIEAALAFVVPGRTKYPKVPYRRFYAPGRVPSFEESITQWQVHQALNVAGPQDIILLGDSSCLMSLRPNQIMRETGLSTWTLATLGFYGVDGHTRLLEAHIGRFAPPRVVVYHVSYWTLKYTKQPQWYQRYLDWLKRVEGRTDGSNAERIRTWLPSLAYREVSRNWLVPETVKVGFLDEPRGGHTSDNRTRKELLEKRGALEEPGVGVWPKAPEVPFGLSEESARALERLFQRAKHHGFGVLVVMEPLPKIAATPNNLAGIEQLQTDLEKLARSHRHVRIADPVVTFLPNDVCQSVTHVLEKGAQQNTARLIEHIGRCEDLMRPLSPKH